MTYELKTFNGTTLGEIVALENNGPGNLSIAREIADIIYSDSVFTPAVDAFVVAGDVTHLLRGQKFTVTGSGYDGTYTLSTGTGNNGDAQVVFVNGQSHIPVAAGIGSPDFAIAGVTTGVSGKFVLKNALSGKHSFLPGLTFTVSGNSFASANATYTIASADSSEIYTVTAVNSTTKTITATGDSARFFLAGSKVRLSGTTQGVADGLYTVVSATSSGGSTAIIVSESISSEVAVNSQTRAAPAETITVVTVSGTINASTTATGVAALQSSVVRTFDAPTTISSTAAPRVFNVVYNVPGNYTSTLIAGTPVLIKQASVDSQEKSFIARVVSTTFIAVSGSYPTGLTQVATQYTNSTATTPVIVTGASSRMVFPVPPLPYGLMSYTSDTTLTPLKLVGKGATSFNATQTWGHALQESVIHATEHFRGATPPAGALTGQIWHDTTTPALRLKTKQTYEIVGVVTGSSGTQGFKIDGQSVGWAVGDKFAVYDNDFYKNTAVFTVVSTSQAATASTSSGYTTTVVVSESIDAGANVASARDYVVPVYGKAFSVTQMEGLVVPGFPTTNDVNLNNHKITNLADATADTDALNRRTGDSRYVNVTGDSMSGNLTMTGSDIILQTTGDISFDAAGSGNLTMSGSGSITVAQGNVNVNTGSVVVGSTATDRVTIANNASGAPTMTWNTTTSTATTGNAVIDLGSNKITNSSAPTVSSDVATKQYVDDRVNGIIWISPILDPNLFDDSLSTPPVVAAGDTLITYHRTYIVNGTGTGAWAGFNGHAMYYDGSTWKSVLGRAVQVGDRFGVYIEPDDDDTLATPTAGGLTGHAGKIATVTGVSPFTYSFYVPAEPDAVSVRGTATGSSLHFGHSYTFRGTHGSGSYGTGYRWIEFSGPQMLVDGAGLRYVGNILNIGAGTGITVGTDSVSLNTTYADGRYVTKAASSTLSSGVNITFAGGGEVLGLPAAPTVDGAAASKKYVDDQIAANAASVTTADTAPSSPSDGDMWLDTTTGGLYIYVDDGSSSQWIEVGSSSSSGSGGAASVTTSDTAPSTPVDGDMWLDTTDGSLNVYVDDGTSSQWFQVSGGSGSGSNAKYFSATISSDQAQGSGFQKLINGTSEQDTTGGFNSTTGRFTAQESGMYFFAAAVNLTASISGNNFLTLYKNGAEFRRGFQTDGAQMYSFNVATFMYLAAGDYVEPYTLFGAARTATNPGVGTYFQGMLVAPGTTSVPNLSPDTKPTSVNAIDDEFEGSSLDVKWVWRNQGTATASVSKGAVILSLPANGGSDNIRWIEQTLPAGAWRIQAKLRGMAYSTNNSVSLGLYNTSSGRIIVNGRVNDSNIIKHFVAKYNSTTSYNGNIAASADLNYILGHGAAYQYIEIEYDGTTYFFRASASGEDGTFHNLGSEAAVTFIGTADRIFIGGNGWGSNGSVVICDWFRRIA